MPYDIYIYILCVSEWVIIDLRYVKKKKNDAALGATIHSLGIKEL